MSAQSMKGIDAGSTSWASGEPPRVSTYWEGSIIDLAEKGDTRFVEILRKNVQRGVIKSERAHKVLGMNDAAATT